jgi:hypothetical protein
MNQRRLGIYLNDHLAAADAAIARARASIRANQSTPLADSLHEFLVEAEEDRRALVEVMQRLGVRRARLKELAALTSERAGRLKLNGRLLRYSPLSRLEELELFAAGAALKARLWETLMLLSDGDSRLDAAEYASRQHRADAQANSLASIRREWVQDAFS